jgi:hypothetical protein
VFGVSNQNDKGKMIKDRNMWKGKSFIRWSGLAVVVTLILIGGITVYGVEKAVVEPETTRTDVIVIDTLAHFGKMERPQVAFLHARHTQALASLNRDCSACHLKESAYEVIPGTLKNAAKNIDRLSPKFKRLKDVSKKEVMDVYHEYCIGCHREMKADGEKSGPQECGQCHNGEIPPSSWQQLNFDQSLHFRHSQSQSDKCEKCHHEYDEKNKKLTYNKGKEGSCRYCHAQKTEGNRVSMRLASHVACINCHRDTLARKEDAGPVDCSGCHSAEAQKKIKKVEDIPRYARNQPDITLITNGVDDSSARMNFTPFNHKAHESYNASCRDCHHANLEACGTCHTLAGLKEGAGVNIEQAMHKPDAKMSCLGCHVRQQNKPECAGCHFMIEKRRSQADSSACLKCHQTPPKSAGKPVKMPLSKEASQAMAAAMLKTQPKAGDTFKDQDIPEKIVIKQMADKYGPVEFPHRKIIDTLTKQAGANKLAANFHNGVNTICQGCHHNSPASATPPKCGNCHSSKLQFNAQDLSQPSMKGVYHIQCMGCHQKMGLEKSTGCTDCHKERK